jgi:hypothetical protein
VGYELVTVYGSGCDRQPDPAFQGEEGEEGACPRTKVADHCRLLLIAGKERLRRREVLCAMDVSRSHGPQLLGRNPGKCLVAIEELIAMDQLSKELTFAPDSPRCP